MKERITSSPHFATAVGFFVATLGVSLAVCLIVGVSITITLIGEMVQSWF